RLAFVDCRHDEPGSCRHQIHMGRATRSWRECCMAAPVLERGTRRQGLAAPPSRRRSPHCSNLHSDHLNQGFSGRGHIAKFNFRNTSATAASRRSRPWSSSLARYGLVKPCLCSEKNWPLRKFCRYLRLERGYDVVCNQSRIALQSFLGEVRKTPWRLPSGM